MFRTCAVPAFRSAEMQSIGDDLSARVLFHGPDGGEMRSSEVVAVTATQQGATAAPRINALSSRLQ